MAFLKLSLAALLFYASVLAASQGSIRLDHQFGNNKLNSKDLDEKAFLGDLEPNELEKMDPNESKQRLGVIFNKIDSDGDKRISEMELKDWIMFTQNRYMLENTEYVFDEHDLNKDKLISWPEYEEASQKLGSINIEGHDHADIDLSKGTDRDKRKFLHADVNSDGYCNKEEFQGFVHPEQRDYMKQFLVNEAFLEMDTNNNGLIEKDEYVRAVSRDEDGSKNTDWVENELQNFDEYLDKNHDGKLDSEEILQWVAPESSEQALEEAQHLMGTVDENKDAFISKEEMLKHVETFINSQVTDYGELLLRHDEL